MTDIDDSRPNTEPVEDWATDYDIFDPEYVVDPVPVWEELRGRCPVAHTERWEGSWMPTRYDDVRALAKMVPQLSSRDPLVTRPPEDQRVENPELSAPPITADPPLSEWTRRLILPPMAPKAVEAHRPYTEALAHELIDGFIQQGHCDAAADYAQQIPPRVIAHLLGIDPARADDFTTWVRGVLEIGLTNQAVRVKYRDIIREFLTAEVEDRMANPKDDFISQLLAAEVEGVEVTPRIVVGMCNLLLIAGIDTTWSSIGSALWHFATHPDDRRRLAADDGLFPTAIEEMLRYYAPVTMAREATEEIEFQGVTFQPGDKVLMTFPAANHDPEAFTDADQIQIDRQRNRHIAFGSGIHRCAGSNLARLEMDVALRVWFERIPEFELADPDAVTWAGGQVRGPRALPMRF